MIYIYIYIYHYDLICVGQSRNENRKDEIRDERTSLIQSVGGSVGTRESSYFFFIIIVIVGTGCMGGKKVRHVTSRHVMY